LKTGCGQTVLRVESSCVPHDFDLGATLTGNGLIPNTFCVLAQGADQGWVPAGHDDRVGVS
jgi:hypothetical protein